jgi:hypothetical protein
MQQPFMRILTEAKYIQTLPTTTTTHTKRAFGSSNSSKNVKAKVLQPEAWYVSNPHVILISINKV